MKSYLFILTLVFGLNSGNAFSKDSRVLGKLPKGSKIIHNKSPFIEAYSDEVALNKAYEFKTEKGTAVCKFSCKVKRDKESEHFSDDLSVKPITLGKKVSSKTATIAYDIGEGTIIEVTKNWGGTSCASIEKLSVEKFKKICDLKSVKFPEPKVLGQRSSQDCVTSVNDGALQDFKFRDSLINVSQPVDSTLGKQK
ncbi:MAG: hypothetical protein ACJAT2_002848 [Bacteriovoracaceae bacterium]|jgi:hypothetical protein